MTTNRLARAAASLLLPVAASSLLAVACAPKHTVDTLRRQVAALEAQNFQLRKDLTEARVRLEMQREEAPRSTSSPGAGGAAAKGPPSQENALPARDTGPRVIYSEPMTPSPQPAGGSPIAAGPADSEAGNLLAMGRSMLDSKDPDGALTVFRQIVSRLPDDPLADDAQFGAGECYFAMGRYEEAIGEYRKVVNNFPFGDQVPFAFLKIGFAHLALEQRDLAMDNFRNVSEAYPGTEAATVARQQIAHLKASGK